MKNNTNTNTNITVNANALRELRKEKADDANFKASLERVAKLASYVVARSNWQTMINAGTFDGIFTNPVRSLEIKEENRERFDDALSKFYRAFLWLCTETKKTTKKTLVNTRIEFNEEQLVEAASEFLATEVEIVRINKIAAKVAAKAKAKAAAVSAIA